MIRLLSRRLRLNLRARLRDRLRRWLGIDDLELRIIQADMTALDAAHRAHQAYVNSCDGIDFEAAARGARRWAKEGR